MRARRLLPPLALAGAFGLARGPLHAATFRLPVSNDDAILLLMGRHVLKGELATTLWNQPYNGALDAYLLAPLLAVLPHHEAYRLYQLLCAALLVVLAGLLARRLGGPAAGFAAALLAAWGTPYAALMTATGPPPNFLVPLVTGFPLAAALAWCGADPPGVAPRRAPGPGAALGFGLVCGLAVWCSSLAIPAFAGMAAGLALAGLRPRPARAAWFAAGAAIGAAPLAVARLIGASGSKVETASSAVTAIRPSFEWVRSVQGLGHALAGIAGLQVPLVVDGKERASLPLPLVVVLAIGLALALAAGARSRRALPLLGWAGALAGAFWLSRRTGPDELRYLYGLNAPLAALAGTGIGAAWRVRRGAAVALAGFLLVPWGWGQRLSFETWSDPTFAYRVWEVPSLEPAEALLREAGTRSAYASLQLAGRLTLEMGGGLIASQAWNERIPGDPLRFRDEVDLDPEPAWVLSQRLSHGMPRAGGFRAVVSGMGGSFRERQVADITVFDRFLPPYDESRPVPRAAIAAVTTSGEQLDPAAFDRDPATRWTSAEGLARGSGIALRLAQPRRLAALVLMLDLEASPLAVPWVATIAGEVVASGAGPGGAAVGERRAARGKQALLAIGLGGRLADEVRLVFQGPGPRLAVNEVFVYGPDEALVPPDGARLRRGAPPPPAGGAGTRHCAPTPRPSGSSRTARPTTPRGSSAQALAGQRWLDVGRPRRRRPGAGRAAVRLRTS